MSFHPFHPCRVLQLPGCLLVAILGIVVNIPLISIISLYKGPILLFKGWQQLIRDLIGREGPFLETVCVPFAGLWILLWPFVVLFAIIAGILSSVPIGCYSAVVAYQVSLGLLGVEFTSCHHLILYPVTYMPSYNCTSYFVITDDFFIIVSYTSFYFQISNILCFNVLGKFYYKGLKVCSCCSICV